MAFLVSPLVTPVVFIAEAALARGVPLSEQVPGYFLLYGSFAYLATAALGIPAYFLFRALKWSNILLFVLGGAAIGFIFSFFIFEGYPANIFWIRLGDRLWCVLAGALSALAFRMFLFGLNFNHEQRVPMENET
ncbi:MAG: hypothetical protein H0U60_19855 [Blastocatellia bacterium]|nr:hypothetical protein [Blastocatellia bacterium]